MRLIGATNYMIRAPFVGGGVGGVLGALGAAVPLAGMYALYQRAVIYISEHYQMLTGMFEPIPLGKYISIWLQQPGAWCGHWFFCQLFYHPPSLEGIGKEDVNEDKTLDLCGSAVRRSFDRRYGGICSLRHQCGDRGCQETGICFGRGKEEGGEYLNQLEGLKADTAAYVKKLDAVCPPWQRSWNSWETGLPLRKRR